ALGPVEGREDHVVARDHVGYLVVVQVDATAARWGRTRSSTGRTGSGATLGGLAAQVAGRPEVRSGHGGWDAGRLHGGEYLAQLRVGASQYRDGRPRSTGSTRQLDLPGGPRCF